MNLRRALKPRRNAIAAIKSTPITAPIPIPAFAPVDKLELEVVAPIPWSVCCGGRLETKVDVIKVLDKVSEGAGPGADHVSLALWSRAEDALGVMIPVGSIPGVPDGISLSTLSGMVPTSKR